MRKFKIGKLLLITAADYQNFGIVLLLVGLIAGSVGRLFIALEFLAPVLTAISLVCWLLAGLCFYFGHIFRYKGGSMTVDEAFDIARRYVREFSKDKKAERAELAEALSIILDYIEYQPILATQSVTKEEVTNESGGES